MQVLSQAKAKQIRGLHQKKERQTSGLFLVEGAKSVLETLKTDWEILLLVATTEFFEQNALNLEPFKGVSYLASREELGRISSFHSNDSSIAVVRKRAFSNKPDPNAGLWLSVYGLSDPGNLGTIIRVADWFGLTQLICLGDVVEWFNPKVISSSMGSFLRIDPVFIEFEELKKEIERPILAADMEGTSIHGFPFPQKCTLLIGNEAHGLPDSVLKNCDHRISIPRFGKAESLNAAMATGILLNQWRFSL